MKLGTAVACTLLMAAPAAAAPYAFTPITTSAGTFIAQGLNDRNQFSGLFYSTPNQAFGDPAIVGGNATTILFPSNNQAVNVPGINDAGVVVGSSGTRFSGAFAYQNGRLVNLGLPGNFSYANGINNTNQVVGAYNPSEAPGYLTYGFVYDKGIVARIAAPDATYTTAADINDAGVIVGSYAKSSGGSTGFVLSGGVFTSFSVPGATSTQPIGINNSGVIVGSYVPASGGETRGFLDVGGVISDLTDAEDRPFVPTGLNNAGQVVGSFAGGRGTFLGTPDAMQPVPEPSTLALFGLPVLTCIVARRRRGACGRVARTDGAETVSPDRLAKVGFAPRYPASPDARAALGAALWRWLAPAPTGLCGDRP